MIDMKSIILFTLLWVSALPLWIKFLFTVAWTLEHIANHADDLDD
jgi:hypothetical protein